VTAPDGRSAEGRGELNRSPRQPRVALYWAPEVDDPLHALGSAWLGRDAETGAALPQPAVPGIAEITADPRGYGLHATLKAPFRFTAPWAKLRDAAAALAARTAPFDLPPLAPVSLGGFLALCEVEPCPALRAFADACVEALDPFRAPTTPEEYARRRPERLSPRQRALLDQWGYHLVFEEWRFHVTLTRRLAEEERAALLPAIAAHFGDAPARPRRVRELCLFTQAAPGAAFLIAERLPLRG
jgi:putative phosphonate metabolism protein